MDQRKEELERKRKKLAELRKAREERKVQIAQSPVKQPQQNVEQLVASLVGKAEIKEQQPVEVAIFKSLTRNSFVIADIKPPVAATRYDKQTQTSLSNVEEKLRQEIMENEVPKLVQEALSKIKQPVVKEVKQPKAIKKTKVNIAQLLQSQQLDNFVIRAARILERAIDEKHYDIFTDYTSQDTRLEENKTLNLTKTFIGSQPVTDLDWSSFFPELSLSASCGQDGPVNIWNLHSQSSEFILKAISPIACASFSCFHPNIVIGGVNSGQVVIWDIRTNSAYPVLSSSNAGHSQRIQGLQMVGSSKAHNLTSVSEDGIYNSWQMDMLAKPLDTISIFNSLTLECSVSSYGFPSVVDTSMFYVGLEDGRVRAVNIHDQIGMKSGIIESLPYVGHMSSVSALHCHPAKGGELSELFLTSSFDWSVKLWKKDMVEPQHSFEAFDDYVYDVKWSPVHPAVFACVDGSGTLSVWNINQSIEEPVYSLQVQNAALNKVSWNKFGNKVSCAGRDGQVMVYDVAIESSPKDTSQLLRRL